MDENFVTEYYNYLISLARSKITSEFDAEDIVSETFIRALAYEKRGGVIKHYKTWLHNTMMNVINDLLRKKYKYPTVVQLDTAFDMPTEEDDDDFAEEEKAAVRREVNYLSKITREVIILYYFTGLEVKRIAEILGIPEGTVKSRLDSGRRQVKKGMETMAIQKIEKTNAIPGRLNVVTSGAVRMDMQSTVGNDLIMQNLLILAYEKPITISELSRMISIPAAYIEPIVDKLCGMELMAKTESGKVYTDFIIYNSKDAIERLPRQKKFAEDNFDTIWTILEEMLDKVRATDFYKSYAPDTKVDLERHMLLKTLQHYFNTDNRLLDIRDDDEMPLHSDGCRWRAMGFHKPADVDEELLDEVWIYEINGGLRTINCFGVRGNDKIELCMNEFDVCMFDDGGKAFIGGWGNYCNYMHRFLWSVWKDRDPIKDEIPMELINEIDEFIDIGYFERVDGKLKVLIPILSKAEFDVVNGFINEAISSLIESCDDKYREFLKGEKMSIPAHLTGITDLYRYRNAKDCIPMSIIRLAYAKGLHLKGADHAFPPVIMVYDEHLENE